MSLKQGDATRRATHISRLKQIFGRKYSEVEKQIELPTYYVHYTV